MRPRVNPYSAHRPVLPPSEPLDADRHSADLFEAYALGDDSDWTWLASTQPVSVEATAHWVLGKVLDDDWCPLPLSICAPKRR